VVPLQNWSLNHSGKASEDESKIQGAKKGALTGKGIDGAKRSQKDERALPFQQRKEKKVAGPASFPSWNGALGHPPPLTSHRQGAVCRLKEKEKVLGKLRVLSVREATKREGASK